MQTPGSTRDLVNQDLWEWIIGICISNGLSEVFHQCY